MKGIPTPGLNSREWARLPELVQVGLKNYCERRLQPGGFLYRILCGDFFRAVAAADNDSKKAMPLIAEWAVKHAPTSLYGTEENVDAWLAGGGDS